MKNAATADFTAVNGRVNINQVRRFIYLCLLVHVNHIHGIEDKPIYTCTRIILLADLCLDIDLVK